MPDDPARFGDDTAQTRGTRRWVRVAVIGAITGAVLFAAVVFNHNYRILRHDKATYVERLDQCLATALEYIDSRRMELVQYSPNCALTYMIRDMADLTGDQRLYPMVEGYANKFPNCYWLRLVYLVPDNYQDLQVNDLTSPELANLTDDQRWFYYALGGTGIELESEELVHLMSATDCNARRLTHQLFALNLLQARNPEDEDLRQLRATLCQRIASEAAWDARVSDMLYQRIAFLLMSGRDDLIQPRWVEQLIAFQQLDGAWGYRYRPLLFKSVIGELPASEHASVQAAWVLCQLKYRYPEWIERHYPD